MSQRVGLVNYQKDKRYYEKPPRGPEGLQGQSLVPPIHPSTTRSTSETAPRAQQKSGQGRNHGSGSPDQRQALLQKASQTRSSPPLLHKVSLGTEQPAHSLLGGLEFHTADMVQSSGKSTGLGIRKSKPESTSDPLSKSANSSALWCLQP